MSFPFRLRDALGEVGFQLNSAILSVLMMRYIRKDGTLRFGDFVAIILNLSIAFGKFFRAKTNFCRTVACKKTRRLVNLPYKMGIFS